MTWALTTVVTDALKAWAYERGWRSWRELHVPLADERSTGRLDLVVFRSAQPDIVIELDSANVPRSIAKLELARDGRLRSSPQWSTPAGESNRITS